MPGDIAGQDPVFVEHGEAARVLETGRTHSGALGPRAELIERTVAAGEQREIVRLLRSQNDSHDLKPFQFG